MINRFPKRYAASHVITGCHLITIGALKGWTLWRLRRGDEDIRKFPKQKKTELLLRHLESIRIISTCGEKERRESV